MKNSETYWNAFHKEAAEAAGNEYRIATEPTFMVTPEVYSVLPQVKCDMDAVLDRFTSVGIAEGHLGALAIRLVAAANMPQTLGDTADVRGVFYNLPVKMSDKSIRYPFIDVVVPRQATIMSADKLKDTLNKTLRHEMRHVEQQNNNIPLYHRKAARTAARLGTAALGAASAAKFGYDMFQPDADLELFVDMLGVTAGTVSYALRLPLLHAITPVEIDARLFAARNRSLAPITIQ